MSDQSRTGDGVDQRWDERKRRKVPLELSESEWRALARAARRIVAKPGISREEAEDLTQNCLLALVANLPEVRDPKRWIRALASVQFKQHLRQRYRREREEVLASRPAPREAEDLLNHLALRESMERLEPHLKQVLVLRYRAGFTIDEIAEQMELHRKAVYWLRQRAIRHLRRKLRAD